MLKVIDIETTGLSTTYDSVLELSVLDMGTGDLDTWSIQTMYFKPERKIPAKSKAIHHLEEDFLEQASGGLTFAEQAGALRSQFNSRISLVGHNILKFDIPMLQNNLRRAGVPAITYDKAYDLMLLARDIPDIPKQRQPSKAKLYYSLMELYGFSRQEGDNIMLNMMKKLVYRHDDI